MAALGAACRSRAEEYAATQAWYNLNGPALGKARTAIRNYLAPELEKIDALLPAILKM